jgi:hypothetical protein
MDHHIAIDDGGTTGRTPVAIEHAKYSFSTQNNSLSLEWNYLKAWGVTTRIVLMASELFMKILKGFTSLVSLHRWTDHPWPLRACWKPIGAP